MPRRLHGSVRSYAAPRGTYPYFIPWSSEFYMQPSDPIWFKTASNIKKSKVSAALKPGAHSDDFWMKKCTAPKRDAHFSKVSAAPQRGAHLITICGRGHAKWMFLVLNDYVLLLYNSLLDWLQPPEASNVGWGVCTKLYNSQVETQHDVIPGEA